MCGIAGLSLSSSSGLSEPLNDAKAILSRFSSSLAHRGPDSGGIWFNQEKQIGFAHRRLSIVDLSVEGAQPMHSLSGRYTITYNGEVYNFLELQKELINLGVTFRGSSDTEVLLAGFEVWGIEATVKKCNGMFAFGVWDERESVLSLVRDRIGVKPLYYGWCHGIFIFSSELKPLLSHSGINLSIDRGSLGLFMRYSYVPAPLSIFDGIYKLSQGSILSLSLDSLRSRPSEFSPYPFHQSGSYISPRSYWRLDEQLAKGIVQPFQGTNRELITALRVLIEDSIKLRMRADVPVGAFLSSGIDSSIVVAIMQRFSQQPVKTFTIGVEDDSQNEAHTARRIASYLGTDHHELYASSAMALDIIPQLSFIYDEPFADFSQIPTYLVSRLARQEVTVSLSGDGGDELFGGYPIYGWTDNFWRRLAKLPNWLRRATLFGLKSFSKEQWDKIYHITYSCAPFGTKMPNFGHKMHKLAKVMELLKPEFLYDQMRSQWESHEVVIDTYQPKVANNDSELRVGGSSMLQHMMYLDTLSYLPDDLMVKLDRASMAVGLEAREPLLDYRLVELSCRIPDSLKLRAKVTKWILREIAHDLLPSEVVNLPKRGFSVPLGNWLRGSLREWAEELIHPKRLNEEGFFVSSKIMEKWQDHILGRSNWQYPLWNVLVFQSWLNYWKHNSGNNGRPKS